jgi:signal transduction histidine kinase
MAILTKPIESTAMTTASRKTGIEVLSEMPWGTHFCLFYETKDDLLGTVAPYCAAGLEAHEFCLWVVSEPVSVDEVKHVLSAAIPDLDRQLADRSIEIASARDWYLHEGNFDLKRVIAGWNEKLAWALSSGYAGVRVTGDTAWLEKKNWKDFCEYEEALNDSCANQRLAVLCTYPLAACGATEILDVVRTHQFATAKRCGSWHVIETAGLKQAKAEIKRLNDELEERVVERTRQLTAASEALRQAQAQLAHVTRVTTLGEVTASIAHEVNQPLAAIVYNANACLALLSTGLNLDEVHAALADIVSDGQRAGAIIERVRRLARRSEPEKAPLQLADVIHDVIALVDGESGLRRVAIRVEVAGDLPVVLGDRVQLQQVLLNLLVNGMDAMSAVMEGGERRIEIHARRDNQDGAPAALLSVLDRGVGLPAGREDSVFEAFYTTKPNGMGMGLAISRSIIKSHGGRLWAERNDGPGATFSFSLPAAGSPDAGPAASGSSASLS